MQHHRRCLAYYSLRPIDTHGDVMDRQLATTMGWSLGERLQWRIARGLVVVSADGNGLASITRKGHLRLPAKLRNAAGAEIGQRVLLVAPIDGRHLVIVPRHLLDDLLVAPIRAMLGGDLG